MGVQKGKALDKAADLWNGAKRAARRVAGAFYRARVKLVATSVGERLMVNAPTKVTRNTRIGSNCNFNGMVIEGGGRVTIGDYFHSGRQVLLITQNHDYEAADKIPYDDKILAEDINIGPFVWLGSRVTVLGGVTIGEGAIIQAGSVVVSDIPQCAIAGGHPARVFKYRDIERFNRLKAEGRWH